ncbi:serine protease 7-like [Drosophila eugracilis]|uniref:serine protease 7-like n=1 Tax=Drosophila eugracilis TaxID=29029 RepID=UPI001BDA90EE|nr:serine protease 7-like [Drosophila eugracilis]
MKVIAAVFLWIMISHEASAQYRGCRNPNHRTGQCIEITQCPTLNSQLMKRSLTDSERQFIRASRCPSDQGNQVYFCCTQDKGYLRIPPVPPPTTAFAYDPNLVPGKNICGGDVVQTQILGGDEALRTEFPWMVLLEYHNGDDINTHCAGSLISNQYVITAAHCLDEESKRSPGNLRSVILGVHNRSSLIDCQGGRCEPGVMRVDIEETRMHPDYVNGSDNSVHDIALIRLTKKVSYTPYIRPVCLPSTKGVKGWQSGQLFYAAGWGRTSSGYMSETKQKVELNFVEKARCSRRWLRDGVNLTETQICAGGKEGKDTCQGDSGGPLMSFQEGVWVLGGIVSFGHKCGQKGWPSIYTNVIMYDDWIKKNMRHRGCRNPNYRTGQCMEITQCPALNSQLMKRNLTDSERQFLKASRCPSDQSNQVFACCTQDKDYLRMPPVPPPTTAFAYDPNLVPGDNICGGDVVQSHILSGIEAVLTEFSWMALLEYVSLEGKEIKTNCAGSLINQQYVLTAAHCVTGRMLANRTLVSVRLGEHDTRTPLDCRQGICSSNIVRRGIQEIRWHPNYTNLSISSPHDIALVRLTSKVSYTPYIRPICLPSTVGVDGWEVDQLFIVAGWGYTLEGTTSPTKQKAGVKHVDNSWCRRRFAEVNVDVEETQICAGGEEGVDSCTGDSGGPLMAFRRGVWVLGGVVSFGRNCGQNGWPGVYTNVAKYDDWIKRSMRS